MYEESLRMPFIMRYPLAIPAGSVYTEMILNVDFAPTFLAFSGLSIPEEMQGHSFRPVIKNEVPDDWQGQPHKLAQKDVDARCTKKNSVSHYGYKNHVNTDVGYGFIRRYVVTDAAVHDSRVLGELLDAENTDDEIWADSAYFSAAVQAALYWMGFISHIHERAYRNRPLSEEQKTHNTERSRTRANVEHIFGTMTMTMGGKLVRSIGFASAKTQLGLKNLTFNLQRYVFWHKQELLEAAA